MTEDTPLRTPYVVVDEFLPVLVANEMRIAVERHFGTPYGHSPEVHMRWEYWHVPGQYTYLRTLPEHVLGPRLTSTFRNSLMTWCHDTLGFAPTKHAYLSLYVNGCRQGQHNDSANGRFSFAYSLTKDVRRTSGGETLIWHETDYFRAQSRRPCSGSDFFNSIEPRFNRLVVFDSRMPHAVQLVEGNMDPVEGRIVIHGHIRETGPIVSGALEPLSVEQTISAFADAHASVLSNVAGIYHGPAAVRFIVAPDGSVIAARLILDRMRRLRQNSVAPADMLANLLSKLDDLRFPGSSGETVVTWPIGIG